MGHCVYVIEYLIETREEHKVSQGGTMVLGRME